MTNFGYWDKKAAALEREASEEDKREKENSDRSLGLQDGPQGPATAKAKAARNDMSQHSQMRRNFIAEQQRREVILEHAQVSGSIVLTEAEVGKRAVRLRGCQDVQYEIPQNLQLIKLFVERCRNVTVTIKHPMIASSIEINYCSELDIVAHCSLATAQCDNCYEGPVRFQFSEPEHVGNFIHYKSPVLQVGMNGGHYVTLGKSAARQYITRPRPGAGAGHFVTEAVVRDGGDFPLNAFGDWNGTARVRRNHPQLEAELGEGERRAKAEEKRQEGNSAFKANDFLQAAVFYTEAIDFCPDLYLAFANRAQCFLHTAQPDKALEDATKCTELAPEYAKGWFRKGMALHALQRYGQAVPALGEAEKLDPQNTQIPDAIKMSQLMCRRHGPHGDL